jgi:hypothetical protein
LQLLLELLRPLSRSSMLHWRILPYQHPNGASKWISITILFECQHAKSRYRIDDVLQQSDSYKRRDNNKSVSINESYIYYMTCSQLKKNYFKHTHQPIQLKCFKTSRLHQVLFNNRSRLVVYFDPEEEEEARLLLLSDSAKSPIYSL